MSKVIAEYNDLKLIADAIRNRTGETSDLSLGQMPSAIVGIESPDPVLQTKTVTPTTNVQNVTPDSGYDGLGKVTVNAIPSTYIQPSGTKTITTNGTHDVKSYASATVNVAGIDTSDATATVEDILASKTAYVDGEKITGNIQTFDGSYECSGESTGGGGASIETCTLEINVVNSYLSSVYYNALDDNGKIVVKLKEAPTNQTISNFSEEVVVGSMFLVNTGLGIMGQTQNGVESVVRHDMQRVVYKITASAGETASLRLICGEDMV